MIEANEGGRGSATSLARSFFWLSAIGRNTAEASSHRRVPLLVVQRVAAYPLRTAGLASSGTRVGRQATSCAGLPPEEPGAEKEAGTRLKTGR